MTSLRCWTRHPVARLRARILVAVTLLLHTSLASGAAAQRFTGPALHLERIADGVYATVFDSLREASANSNSLIIINDHDVIVIDTQGTPAAASLVIAEIRKLTALPVRYVVNTHFHSDHLAGNQTYRATYPGVEFIMHPNTQLDVVGEMAGLLEKTIKADIPEQLAQLRKSAETATGARLATLNEYISFYEWHVAQLKEVHLVGADLSVSDSLVIHRGARDIVVAYAGLANTRGDLVVYLPKERVLATGDVLVAPTPYATESFIAEWPAALRRLHALPVNVIVPGHGPVEHDFRYMEFITSLLDSTMSQVRGAVAKGLDLEATRKAVDLSEFRNRIVQADPRVGAAFDAYYTATAVASAWREARSEAKPASRDAHAINDTR